MNPDQRKILLIDLSMWKGHHALYFKAILKIFTRNGYFVYAASADNEALSEFIRLHNISNCEVVSVASTWWEKVIFRALKYLDAVLKIFLPQEKYACNTLSSLIRTRSIIRRTGERHLPVFFTSLDSTIPFLPAWIGRQFFPRQWSGIYVNPPYGAESFWGRDKQRQRVREDRVLTMEACKSFFVIHPVYEKYYRRLLKTDKCIAIPEPIDLTINEASPTARRILRQAKGRQVITMLGFIGRKKNILLFLDVASRLDKEKFFFAVVGKFVPQEYSSEEKRKMHTLLEELGENIFLELDRYIDAEEEFNALINASDWLYIHYLNHVYSSNQLLKAIALRKFAIVNKGFLMERIVRENAWQLIVDQDTDHIAAAIEQGRAQFRIDEVKYQRYMQYISEANLERLILQAFTEKARSSRSRSPIAAARQLR